MRNCDTIFLVTPPTAFAWALAVTVVGAFLLADETRGLGTEVSPVIVAFWVNLLMIIAGSVGRLHKTVRILDGSFWTVSVGIGFVFGVFAAVTVAGENAILFGWVGYFVLQSLFKLWISTCDVDFLVRYHDVKPRERDDLSTIAMFEALALAIAAACLAALAFAAPVVVFVAFATFGWLTVLFFCNWLAVLILLEQDGQQR